MISVIIPTHNRSNLIGRAIESAQKQTFRDVEIIVVSDGSNDDTEIVVNKYSDGDSRIRFIGYSPSKGGNYARNLGIKSSKGEYVAFLDDDDEWMPDKLEKQMRVMDADNNIALVYTGCSIIYVNDNVVYSALPTKCGDLSKEILLDNYIGSTSTVLIRKDFFQKSGLFDEALGALQDYDLWIRIAQHGHIGVVTEELINYYNYRGSNQVSALTEKYEKAFEHINQKYADIFGNLSTQKLKIKKQNEYFLLGNKAMRNNDSKQARAYFRKLLRIGFSSKAVLYYLLTYTNFKIVLKIRSII